MMNEIEMSSTRRRKSVPEIINTIASDDDDDVQLIDQSNIDPNDIKEPEEPIYSRGRLCMDGGFAEHLRSMTPEPKSPSEAFKNDLMPDGAFQDLRPRSPVYIPQHQRDFAQENSLDSSMSLDEASEDHLTTETADQEGNDDQNPDGAFMGLRPSSPKYVPKYQRFNSHGDSVDQDDSTNEPSYPADCEISNLNQESRSSKFKLVRSDSDSGRMLVKIPLDPKLADIDEEVLFDRSTNGTTDSDSEKLSLPSYPVSMTTFNRGVAPSGQMDLVQPKQQTLSTLRARLKIDFGRDIHNTIDLLKSRISNVHQQQSVDEDSPPVQPDLMDIMDDSGQIIWDREDDEKDIEEILGLSIAGMTTMKPEEFQNLDPSNILDTYLTKDYIIIETSY